MRKIFSMKKISITFVAAAFVLALSISGAYAQHYDQNGSVEFNGIKIWKIDTECINLVISSGAGTQAQIRLSGDVDSDTAKRVDFTTSVKGATANINAKIKYSLWERMFGSVPDNSGRLTLEIVLPPNLEDEIILQSTKGSVEISQLRAKRLDADLSMGSTYIKQITAGQITVNNRMGEVSVDSCNGGLEISNSMGSISVYAEKLSGNIKLDCSMGNIRLKINQPANYVLKTSSTMGSVSNTWNNAPGGSGIYKVNASVRMGNIELVQ